MANSTILYAPKPSTGTTLYIVNDGQTPDIKNLSKEILKSYEDGRSDDLAKLLRKLHLHISNDIIF
jgi:hypothetical protein